MYYLKTSIQKSFSTFCCSNPIDFQVCARKTKKQLTRFLTFLAYTNTRVLRHWISSLKRFHFFWTGYVFVLMKVLRTFMAEATGTVSKYFSLISVTMSSSFSSWTLKMSPWRKRSHYKLIFKIPIGKYMEIIL